MPIKVPEEVRKAWEQEEMEEMITEEQLNASGLAKHDLFE